MPAHHQCKPIFLGLKHQPPWPPDPLAARPRVVPARRSKEIQGLVMADQGRPSITPVSPQAAQWGWDFWGARVVDLGI